MRNFQYRLLLPFFLAFTFICCTSALTAQDSSRLRISLLTCTPGDELYSIFGHSAIRVTDSNSVSDIVYNYGTFNFDDEGFYLKFMRGKLMYFISTEYFNDFKYLYQSSNRGIYEQELNFTQEEKLQIRAALNENLREENRFYKYDFFLDNCTSRLRDLILKNKTPTPDLPPVMGRATFRQAIYIYLNQGKQYWSKLGIDILLGARTDAVMTSAQQKFLPDNLMHSIDSCRNMPLVNNSGNLYPIQQNQESEPLFTPLFFFSLLLIFFILLSFSTNKYVQTILAGLDGILFFLTGMLGVILVIMWAYTDHSMTKDNYNLLWAWPSHLAAAFFINSRKKIIKLYLMFTAVGMTGLLLSWFFLPQQMNNALLPFVLLIIFRSVQKTIKKKNIY